MRKLFWVAGFVLIASAQAEAPLEIGPLKRGSDGVLVPAGPGEAPSGVGRIVRDAEGRLIPAEGEDNRAAAAARGMPGIDRLYLETKLKHDVVARNQQDIIDRVIREERARKAQGASVDARGLTERERHLVGQLRETDRAVREHEMRHYYSGLPYASPPEYWEVRGPDGQRYAVTGIVRFDSTPIAGDTAATIAKLAVLHRAALAPHTPSAEDVRLADALHRLIVELRQTQP